jgi:tetratricopeptide (TPR) repeat protein
MNFEQWRYYCLGRFWQTLRHPGKALVAYDQSRKHGPHFTKALRHVAYLHASQARYTEAEQRFGEAVLIEPGDANTHFNLGYIRDQMGRHEQAIASFAEAVRLNPALDRAWYGMGMACHHARDPERVREVILHLNRFDPVMARQLIRDTGASDMAHLVKDLAV